MPPRLGMRAISRPSSTAWRPALVACAGWALACLAASGCSSRPHVGDRDHHRDAAPAVVVVDRPAAPGRGGQAGAAAGVALVDEVEPNGDLVHAQPFPFPKGIRGHVAPPALGRDGKPGGGASGDDDLYRFEPGPAITRPTLVRVELGGVAALALALDVLDASGVRLVAALDAGPGEPQVVPDLRVEPGRTYYLRVHEQWTRSKTHGDAVHPYTLVVVPLAPTPNEVGEPDDKPAQAGPLPLGGEATGYFGHRHEEDWLRILPEAGDGGAELPAGSSLRLRLGAVEGVAATVRVTAGDGTVLAEAHGSKGERLELRNAPLRASGTLVMLRADTGYNVDQRWLLEARAEPLLEAEEVEPNDVAATATALVPKSGEGAATAKLHAYLWPGDADVFRVHVDLSSAVRVEVDPPLAPPVDLRLEVIPPGTYKGDRVLRRIDDAGPGHAEALPDWFVPAGGELYVRVSGRPRDALFDLGYEVRVSLGAGDHVEREPNDAAATATPLTPGEVMRGFLSPRNDADWYLLPAPPAGAARVRVTLDPTPGGTSPTLQIVDGARPTATSNGKAVDGPLGKGPTYVVVKDQAGKPNARDAYQLTVVYE